MKRITSVDYSPAQLSGKLRAQTEIQEQLAKRGNYVSIEFEGDGIDWFEPCLKTMYRLSNILSGGYYEPKSQRDAELGAKLYDLLSEYKEELDVLLTNNK